MLVVGGRDSGSCIRRHSLWVPEWHKSRERDHIVLHFSSRLVEAVAVSGILSLCEEWSRGRVEKLVA